MFEYTTLCYVSLGFRNACLFIVLYHNETTQYLSTSLRFILLTVIINWTSHTYYTQKEPQCDGFKKTTYWSHV